MTKSRLEAFGDGVLAIIITIMVLELRVPHGAALTNLQKLSPVGLSYVLSFVNVGIYSDLARALAAISKANSRSRFISARFCSALSRAISIWPY